jgi:hypothetical protein
VVSYSSNRVLKHLSNNLRVDAEENKKPQPSGWGFFLLCENLLTTEAQRAQSFLTMRLKLFFLVSPYITGALVFLSSLTK